MKVRFILLLLVIPQYSLKLAFTLETFLVPIICLLNKLVKSEVAVIFVFSQ